MGLSNILALLGGVALFLFGMTLMGDGLKKVAGNKLELVLYRLSKTPLKGILLGTGVTAVIQSSSATSVMVVGFVNSGMMKVKQAIAIVLGALLGTSITGWIICLSSIEGTGWVSLLSTSNLTAAVAVIGIILRMFTKKQLNHNVGNILLGFAVLMYGMSAMSGSVAPLKESPVFISFLTTFSNPLLGILIGAAFTSILQSASAAVGILQALSMTGAVSFAVAYPVILGIAIGAAVPVLLTAVGARTGGKRTALSYLLIEILGVLVCGVAFYGADAVFHFGIYDLSMNPVSIALVNTLFRLVTAIVLAPFIGLIEKLVCSLIKESEQEKAMAQEFDRLEERFISHPALAVEQSRLTVNSMAKNAEENIHTALRLLDNWNEGVYGKVESTEDLLDMFEDKLGTYLMKITGHEMPKNLNDEVAKYLHTISDFERIGDHSMNLADCAREIHEKKIEFSEAAQNELRVLRAALDEIMKNSINAFIVNDLEAAVKVEPLEECIDSLCDEMKMNHVERMRMGVCNYNQGFVFNDILTNIERVADHCSNLAVAMIEISEDEFDTHNYLNTLKKMHANSFEEMYNMYLDKYSI